MVTSLVCFVARGDSENELSSPVLLDELIEMNIQNRTSSLPTMDDYYKIKTKVDELFREEMRKEGLARSKERREKERKLEEKKKEEGLVQLAKEEQKQEGKINWQTFEVTMYTAGYESTQKRKGESGYGITASGNYVQEGVTIACSPDIPFDTRIYIEILDNTYTCEDRGSLITKGKIDVYVNNLDTALQFGIQQSRGYIVKE